MELLFPMVSEAQQETVPAAPQPFAQPQQRYSILLVDDDALVSMSTAAMIEALDHSAFEAASAAEALEILRAGMPIDCVITDQTMPGTTGIELARMMRTEWPLLPVILATGYADLPDSEIAGLPRLAKPYRLNALAAALSRVLHGRQPALLAPAQRANAP